MDEDDGWTTAGSGGGEVQETMENQRSRRGACEAAGRGMCAWSGKGRGRTGGGCDEVQRFHFDGPGGEEEVEAAAVIRSGRRRFWRQAEVDGWDGKTVGEAGRRGRLGW